MISKSKQKDNIEKFRHLLEALVKQLSSDSKSKLQEQIVRKIQSVFDKNSLHRDAKMQLIISSGSLRKLTTVLQDKNSSTSLLHETLHLLSTLVKWQTESAVAELLVDYDCISALLEIMQKTRHDSLAADAKTLLFQLLDGSHPAVDKTKKLNQSHNKDPPEKIKGSNDKPQSTEKSPEIIQQDSACNPNPKFLTQTDIQTFQKLCNWVKNSSTTKTILVGLEGLRTIVHRLPQDKNAYCPSLINKEALPVLTLLMKRFSHMDFVRFESKSVLMALIPKLRPYDTPGSLGMMVSVPFGPLLQRENEALVVDALELLQKYSQAGEAHIDALLESRILEKVIQWQFEKIYSDRRRKCWCGKIKKLMTEIIWEIATRGSDRQVSSLIEELPGLVRAFASILMESQGEAPSCDNAHALGKGFDVFVIVLKKLSQGKSKGQLRSFVSLVEATGTKSCLMQCKGNSHLERHQKAIRKILRFLRKAK